MPFRGNIADLNCGTHSKSNIQIKFNHPYIPKIGFLSTITIKGTFSVVAPHPHLKSQYCTLNRNPYIGNSVIGCYLCVMVCMSVLYLCAFIISQDH